MFKHAMENLIYRDLPIYQVDVPGASAVDQSTVLVDQSTSDLPSTPHSWHIRLIYQAHIKKVLI